MEIEVGELASELADLDEDNAELENEMNTVEGALEDIKDNEIPEATVTNPFDLPDADVSAPSFNISGSISQSQSTCS